MSKSLPTKTAITGLQFKKKINPKRENSVPYLGTKQYTNDKQNIKTIMFVEKGLIHKTDRKHKNNLQKTIIKYRFFSFTES